MCCHCLKEEDIDHARYLISLGSSVFSAPYQALVVAKIGPGNDGINRNYIDQRFPEWSWHVVEFLGFSDRSLIILDGCSTSIENDPVWYRGESPRKGVIALWNFTIVRELGPAPLYMSIVSEGQNLQVYWSSVGTNYVYSLEGKESLASTNWLAIPGASWPLSTNNWTVLQTNATARFYRVKAEQTKQ